MSSNPRYHLFAQPSFIEGMAHVLDIGGTLQIYNESPSESAVDFVAPQSDWYMIGHDMREAIKKYERLNGGTAEK